MKCHYETLGLERNCSLEDVKKAYKKLALQWHPDKNLDRVDETQEQFTLIQQAYDVLSDRQEREWYDRHREKILRGGFDEHYQDNALNLFPYFTSAAYKGFGDDEHSFYTVYRIVFEAVTAEDTEFVDESERVDVPGFGDRDSDYDAIVGPFYAHWQSYCTARSYVWKDKYDFKQAGDRRTWRQMEKENKKLRLAAKKERNEVVRELVAFVRKRDKRVQAYRRQLEERRAEQMKRVEELSLEQRKTKLRDLQNVEIDETEVNLHREALDDIEATWQSSGASSDEDDNDDIYCIACEKSFRTEKALKNHEKSKKHKENVEILKTAMQEDDFNLLNLENGESSGDDETQEVGKRRKKKKSKKKETADTAEETIPDLEPDQKSDQISGDLEPTPECPSSSEPTVPAAQKSQQPSVPVETKCKTCGEFFGSKTKLFKHLSESGHAAIRPELLLPKKPNKNKKLRR